MLHDGGPVPPLLDGIEDELTATKCVLSVDSRTS